jgi:hypothetical protein
MKNISPVRCSDRENFYKKREKFFKNGNLLGCDHVISLLQNLHDGIGSGHAWNKNNSLFRAMDIESPE